MANTKKSQLNETIDKATDLTERSAKATLDATVKTMEVTEDYVEGMYKVGYDTNVEALKVAKNYWDTAAEIRQDWIKLFAKAGENLITATANMELPLQKEVVNFSKNILSNVGETVENVADKAQAATK